MKLEETKINGCYIIHANRHHDQRGSFQELFSSSDLVSQYLKEQSIIQWHQGNLSYSQSTVVRGIHEAPFYKLVTCVSGSIIDVVIDLRITPNTVLEYQLQSDQPTQILIPPGCGHGFYAISDSIVIYLQNQTYQPGLELKWHIDSFDINWPNTNFILSKEDTEAKMYKGEK